MKVYAMTQKGNHPENEDRILVNGTIVSDGFYSTEADEVFVGVADGVGGNNAGAVASEFVCSNLIGTEEISKETVQNVNAELIKKSLSNDSLNKMATTLSAIMIRTEGTKYVHIGNTRICVFQGNYMRQITEDHTTVQWLVKMGKISKKEAETYEKRNEIIACLGGGNDALAQMLVVEDSETVHNAKRIIITSDGVHEQVSVDELEDFLNESSGDYEAVCAAIIKRAVENGSQDDKSIVIIEK